MPTSNNDRKWWPGEIITASKLNYIEDFLQNINGNFIPMSGTGTNGPYVRGNVTYVPDGVDMTQPNNGVTETIWPSVNRVNDRNTNIIGRFETVLYGNGDKSGAVSAIMYAKNYTANMTAVTNTLELRVNKDGTRQVILAPEDAAAWKEALGIAGTHSLENALYQDNNGIKQNLATSLQVARNYQLFTDGATSSYYNGRDYAFIKNIRSTTQYVPTISMKTGGTDSNSNDPGSWEIATYQNRLEFAFILDSNYNNSRNTVTCKYQFYPNGIFNGTATAAQKIITSNSGGYETDAYGNFKHQTNTSTNAWTIKNSGGTDKFLVNFESGNTTIRGTLAADGMITANYYMQVKNNGGHYLIDRTDVKPSDIPAPASNGNAQAKYYNMLVLRDIGTDSNNPKVRSFIRHVQWSGGTQSLEMATSRIIGSNTLYNYIKLGINTNSTYFVELPGKSGQSASTAIGAWQKVLGIDTLSDDYLAKTGGVMGGSITLSSTGLITPHAAGWSTDQYGNFVHKQSNSGDTWNLKDGTSSHTAQFTIKYDSGTITKGIWNGSKIGYSYLDGVAAASHNHAASNITSGTLGVERGGTGGGSLPAARQNLFRSNLNSTAQFLIGITNNYVDGGYITLPLPLSMGGTGYANSSVSAARTNWQVPYVQKFQIAAGTVETFTFPGNLALVFARRDGDYIVGMVTVWDNTVTIISRSGSDAPAPAISTPENTRSVNVRNRRSNGAIAGMIISYD